MEDIDKDRINVGDISTNERNNGNDGGNNENIENEKKDTQNEDSDPHKHAFQRKPRKRTSTIWNDFEEGVNTDDSKKAKCILDPRYKMIIVNYCFPEIYPEAEANRNIVTVKQVLYEIYNKTVDTIQPSKSDLDIYLDESVFICAEGSTNNFDIMEWWKANTLKFYILSKMACEILSIPITLVASESIFSAGGRVIDPYRASYCLKQYKFYFVVLIGYMVGVSTAIAAYSVLQLLIRVSTWSNGFYVLKRSGKVFSCDN
ncbi:hypothetical protein F0562_019791 [Nyssa sinensis]|uniref:Uncharacterized protein n=1 Tax=Nyssa sinensis TaxID=561372 RepID=A0A5J5BTC6_9ASTE|nr:hypothetical protein F0562_019791 [Nyssa sinensis]